MAMELDSLVVAEVLVPAVLLSTVLVAVVVVLVASSVTPPLETVTAAVALVASEMVGVVSLAAVEFEAALLELVP
jgi:hypothetical protein